MIRGDLVYIKSLSQIFLQEAINGKLHNNNHRYDMYKQSLLNYILVIIGKVYASNH